MRSATGSEEFLQHLEDKIRSSFLSGVTKVGNVDDVMPKVFSLSAKHGGLGITNPACKANEQFDVSRESSSLVADSIVCVTELNAEENKSHVHKTM